MIGVGMTARSCEFQSTPPTRAATRVSRARGSAIGCFNPRRPRGRRRVAQAITRRPMHVSIHAAHEGGDAYAWRESCRSVSIHAAHEGGDVLHRCAAACFNPRRPRGRRLSRR